MCYLSKFAHVEGTFCLHSEFCAGAFTPHKGRQAKFSRFVEFGFRFCRMFFYLEMIINNISQGVLDMLRGYYNRGPRIAFENYTQKSYVRSSQ